MKIYNFSKRALALFLTVCMILPLSLEFVIPVSAAESLTTATADGVSLSAGMYSDAGRTKLVKSLTTTGSTLSGWGKDTTYYLGISLAGLSLDAEYKLVVEMDPVVYYFSNTAPTHGSASVSYNANAKLSSGYTPNKYSFADLTYSINDTASLTVGLSMRFDVNLWSKRAGESIKYGSASLIRVYLQKVGADSSITNIDGLDLKLDDATASGSIGGGSKISLTALTGLASSTLGPSDDDALDMSISQLESSSSYSGGYYCRDVEVKVTLPTCTIGGTKYTLQYSNAKIRSITDNFTTNYEDGVLTLSGNDLYFNNYVVASMRFLAPDGVENIPTTQQYAFKGSVTVKINGQTLISSSALNITFDGSGDYRIVTGAVNGEGNIKTTDVVQQFGALNIKNIGLKDCPPLKIKYLFDVNNTNNIGVTTLNLMCDLDSPTIDIWITFVDKDGNVVKDGEGNIVEYQTQITNKHYNTDAAQDKRYIVFSRQNLPAEYREYYFKTLTYTMGKLRKFTAAFHTGAGKAPYSGGTVWGYMLTDQILSGNERPVNKLEIYEQVGSEYLLNSSLTKTSTITNNAGNSVSYGIESLSVDTKVVSAGGQIAFTGTLNTTSYPYSSNSVLSGIRLGLVLNEGLSLNTASVKLANGKVAVNKIESRDLADGSTLWIIYFDPSAKIGYYSEKLGAIPSGSNLKFNFTIETNILMAGQTVTMKDYIFVAGDGLQNSAGGTFSNLSRVDTHDLNGNGSTTDNIGGISSTSTLSFTVVGQSPTLDIFGDVKETGDDSDVATSISISAANQQFDYSFNLSSGGNSVKSFKYIVPIAGSKTAEDANFLEKTDISGVVNENLILRLTGAATVTHTSGTQMKAYYTFEEIEGYNQAAAFADSKWYESLPDGKTWSDVTAIKIEPADGSGDIVSDSVSEISIPLMYAGNVEIFHNLAGMQITWYSRGFADCTLGAEHSAKISSSNACTVTFEYLYGAGTAKEITLTAAKGDPISGTKIESFELIEFMMAQEYSIKNIVPYGITLVDGSYDFSTVKGSAANTDFRITVSVKKVGTDTPSTPAVIQKDGTLVGKLSGNSAPEFTFKIENAGSISDAVSIKYVTLTIIGNNGVVVNVKINVDRELAQAEPSDPAIVSGEVYSPFDATDTSVDVSRNSSFTAQFITEYLPNNYGLPTLSFGAALATGSKITMIDWTDSSALKYYYYDVKAPTSSITLDKFALMNGTGNYQKMIGADLIKEQLLFIVTFPDNDSMTLGDNSITLTRNHTGGGSPSSATLDFKTVESRVFGVSGDSQSVDVGDELTVTYTSSCGVTDSRYAGRNLALVIGSNGTTALPAETRLRVGNTVYYLNSDGQFIVPLEAAHLPDNRNFKTISVISETLGEIELGISLYCSATSDGARPMMGSMEKAISVRIAPTPESSLTVNRMEPILTAEHLSGDVNVSYTMEEVYELTLSVYKKEAAGRYSLRTDVINAVNGDTKHEQGVYTLRSEATSGRVTIALRFNPNTPNGVYRLLFVATNSKGQQVEVPYNFVVDK